jgi:hypothetical protein
MFVEHQSTSGTKILKAIAGDNSIIALFFMYCIYGFFRRLTLPFAGNFT